MTVSVPSSRSLTAEHAAVASGHPLASKVGCDTLRSGGNAFDAAVATSYALAVTLHPAGGLGGDFFGMFYEARTGKVRCLNASGWSPSGLTLDLMLAGAAGHIPKSGPLSCVVPGFVAGVEEMHRELGTQELRKLLAPSVALATDGFAATVGLCRAASDAFRELPKEAREIFAPAGSPPTPGELIKQPTLGRVISDIAGNGAAAFYSGRPAEHIVSFLDSLGVPCKQSDFADYRPEWVTPLKLAYRGTTVYEVPPNSMGATSLLILKLLAAGGPLTGGPLSIERVSRTMKAALTAYARRDEMLGDPRFGPIDVDAFLSSPAATPPKGGGVREGDTTAFSVVDSEGNMVAGIQSLFQQFGSRLFVPACGVVLNNRASGFSTHGPNKAEPRKRPLHTLSSMILERDGRPHLAIGCSGGDYRPLQHTLFVTNSVDYSMSAEQIVAHPRFLWGGGRTLIAEEGFELPEDGTYTIRRLPMPGNTGACQAVEISDRGRKAVCDVRGDGSPDGF
jgi:gamma-glutamyltranspeptidase / glutathione hydrolase